MGFNQQLCSPIRDHRCPGPPCKALRSLRKGPQTASAASAWTLGIANILAGLGLRVQTSYAGLWLREALAGISPCPSGQNRGRGPVRGRQASGPRSAQARRLVVNESRQLHAQSPGAHGQWCGWGQRGCTGFGSLAPGPRLAAPFCLCSLAISVFQSDAPEGEGQAPWKIRFHGNTEPLQVKEKFLGGVGGGDGGRRGAEAVLERTTGPLHWPRTCQDH